MAFDDIDSETNEEEEGPLITTTAIAIIRYIGRYLYMIKLLQPIGFEIYQAITQMVEYYVWEFSKNFLNFFSRFM